MVERLADPILDGVLSGVLIVDKPKGRTSHDVVQHLRRVLRTRSVGHAGTLDPMATGVLIVAIGEGTKLVPYLTAAEKRYEASIALGTATDTLDAEGTVIERANVPDGWMEHVEAALDIERARTSQAPPAYSAIRKDGVRAHVLARRGEDPGLAPRDVHALYIECVRRIAHPPSIDVVLEVTKGYYVRSFARDLAVALGTVGHLTALNRTRSGHMTLGEASALDAPDLRDRVLPVEHAAARVLPALCLTELGRDHAHAGRAIPRSEVGPRVGEAADVDVGEVVALLGADGRLVAIGERTPDGIRILRGFH